MSDKCFICKDEGLFTKVFGPDFIVKLCGACYKLYRNFKLHGDAEPVYNYD